MNSMLRLICLGVFIATGSGCSCVEKYSYQPDEGYVPDAKTASKIAEAVWVPIYGEKTIAAEKPFKVALKEGVWTVEGADLPPNMDGGVAIIEIAKVDGRILRVSHGQ